MSIYKKVMDIFHNTDVSLKESWLIVKQQSGVCTIVLTKKNKKGKKKKNKKLG